MADENLSRMLNQMEHQIEKEQKGAKLLEDEQRWEEERKRRKRQMRTESAAVFTKQPGPLKATYVSLQLLIVYISCNHPYL